MFGALYKVCQKAVTPSRRSPARRAPSSSRTSARSASRRSARPTASSPATTSRSSTARAQGRWLRHPLYRKPANLLPGGRMAVAGAHRCERGKKKKRGAKRKFVSVLRTRRDRRWRARRPRSGDLLAEGPDRFVLHPHPGLGARAARRRQADAAELRGRERPSLLRGRPLADRPQHRPQGRNVDGPHPRMDGAQSEGRQRAAPAEQVLRVLPRDRSADNEEPIGAQGISLTPGRSIAVDRKLHIYGTPFFISADLPIESLKPDTLVPPADDRAGHRRRDRRPGAGRPLFRRRRRGRQRRRPAAPRRPLRHAGAEGARSRRRDEIPLPRPRPTIEEMAAYETDRGQAKSSRKPTRRSRKRSSKAAAPNRGRRRSPANKARQDGDKAVENRLKKTGDDKKSAEESPRRAAKSEDGQVGRQAGHQAQEQARSSDMSRRRLSDDERVLWKGVTRSIAPLRKFRKPDRRRLAAPAARRDEAARQARAESSRSRSPRRRSRPRRRRSRRLAARPSKRIARGAHAIDGRLDLHGMTQAEAHDALFGFLRGQTGARQQGRAGYHRQRRARRRRRRPRRAQPHGAAVAAAAGIPRPYRWASRAPRPATAARARCM